MDEDRAREIATIYLWMHQQLSSSQKERYRIQLAKLCKTNTAGIHGLDGALREAAERIATLPVDAWT